MTGIGKRGESVVIAGTVRVWSEGRGCRSGQRAEAAGAVRGQWSKNAVFVKMWTPEMILIE